MSSVRVGIVGVGGVGRHHAAVLKGLEPRVSVAVYDVREDVRRLVSGELGVDECDSLESLVKSVDAVLVCTPPHTHPQIIELAAEEGKHVFCEKPLAADLEGAERAVRAIRRHGVLMMMGFVLRFNPLYVRAKELLDEGAIGDVAMAWFLDVRGPFRTKGSRWRLLRRCGSGIFEQVVHDVDAMRWLLGEPETVYAAGSRMVLRDVDYEDAVTYLMRMRGGFTATLVAAICSKKSGSRDFGIVGSEGTLMRRGGGLYLNDEPVECGDWNPFEREDAYFVECVRRGERPEVNEVDGYRAQAIGEAALLSLALGREVRVEYKY